MQTSNKIEISTKHLQNNLANHSIPANNPYQKTTLLLILG